jgi:hypothetical protein
MHQLGMPGGRFIAAVELSDPEGPCAPHGLDTVEFRSAPTPASRRRRSPGSPRAASCRASAWPSRWPPRATQSIPVMVFDEVDSGVAGGVAEIVGRRLAELGARAQVLCVTHLPQVASQARASPAGRQAHRRRDHAHDAEGADRGGEDRGTRAHARRRRDHRRPARPCREMRKRATRDLSRAPRRPQSSFFSRCGQFLRVQLP